MRLAWGALGVACLLAGVWLILRALGLSGAVLHGAGRWWPAFLVAGGVAILLRSVKPGPHVVVSVGLIVAGGLAFAITRGVLSSHALPFIAAGGLITGGMIMAWLAATAQPDNVTRSTERITVLFRPAEVRLSSAERKRVRVFLLCGHLELNLEDAIPPRQRRKSPLMIDVTAWAGNVHVVVASGVGVLNHKAFVLRLNRRLQMGVLPDKRALAAQVIVGTLAFLGDVDVKVKEASQADSRVRGDLLGRETR